MVAAFVQPRAVYSSANDHYILGGYMFQIISIVPSTHLQCENTVLYFMLKHGN